MIAADINTGPSENEIPSSIDTKPQIIRDAIKSETQLALECEFQDKDGNYTLSPKSESTFKIQVASNGDFTLDNVDTKIDLYKREDNRASLAETIQGYNQLSGISQNLILDIYDLIDPKNLEKLTNITEEITRQEENARNNLEIDFSGVYNIISQLSFNNTDNESKAINVINNISSGLGLERFKMASNIAIDVDGYIKSQVDKFEASFMSEEVKNNFAKLWEGEYDDEEELLGYIKDEYNFFIERISEGRYPPIETVEGVFKSGAYKSIMTMFPNVYSENQTYSVLSNIQLGFIGFEEIKLLREEGERLREEGLRLDKEGLRLDEILEAFERLEKTIHKSISE